MIRYYHRGWNLNTQTPWEETDAKPADSGHAGKSSRKKCILFGMLSLMLSPCAVVAADRQELNTDAEKINYSVGYQIGGDFKAQGVELAPDVLVQGIRDALAKTAPLMTQEQMNTTLVNLKKKIVADQQRQEKQAAEENRKASAAFLKEHAKQKGVTVLPSGVQYRIIKAGSGKKPTLQDSVSISYRVTRIDGKEIARTNAKAPRSYPVAKAIPGLQEILPLMEEGAKWEVVLPTSTAAGGREPLDDMGVIIYELELVSVLPAK
ncbi:MAG: peptidylprolyl isomerase [Geobacter sp.]|nr:MAG: peptidylprolyl isomerase [Geobacter sp.]